LLPYFFENQCKNKHVESLRRICLDTGSSPVGSTKANTEIFFCIRFLILPRLYLLMKEKLLKLFLEKFNTEPIIIRSPGRINIIGEHTDYNEGFVLPSAIDKSIYFAISKRVDDAIHLYAEDFKEDFLGNISEIKKTEILWANYVLGVVNELQKDGKIIGGFNAIITSDLPIGAGISSSAALECATAFSLNHIFNLQIEKIDLVKHAQKAEHNFAGVMCGIMDQFASMLGKKNHCIKLDCKTLEYEYVPLKLDGYSIVLLNTNVKHSLASSAYNTRRQECEQAVAWVQEYEPKVNSLRDITEEMLDKYVLPKNILIDKRSRFVVKEIARLQTACTDLQNGNLNALGKKMFETHDGLSKDYEVSCNELDFLVDIVRDNENVIGARMMGGGFGGCTINIVKNDCINNFINEIRERYLLEMKLPLTAIIANIEDGTCLII
jgi:galactokinase